jgi:hypothetical protein
LTKVWKTYVGEEEAYQQMLGKLDIHV